MTDYQGGASDSPLLSPIERIGAELQKSAEDLSVFYIRQLGEGSTPELAQFLSDTLARIDTLQSLAQSYAANEATAEFGTLPPPSPAATIPAIPGDAGYELLTTDTGIINDANWTQRGVDFRTLDEAARYIYSRGLEFFGLIVWDGRSFQVYMPEKTP